MEFYTVKEIADLLSVNEETVRRWIRENRLDAERGAGRQGSKISEESLKKFLEVNRGLINVTTATTLGIGLGGIVGGVAGSIIGGIANQLFDSSSWFKKVKSPDKNKKDIKIELLEVEMGLETQKVQLSAELARIQNEIKIIDIHIEKVKTLINELDKK